MSNINTKFWIELECTFSNFSEFTESEDFKLIGDILKNILFKQLLILK